MNPTDPLTGIPTPATKRPVHPFRRALLRGLGIMLPPLLTLVLFIWAWNAIEGYILAPIETAARYAIVWVIQDVRDEVPANAMPISGSDPKAGFLHGGVEYLPTQTGRRFLPSNVKLFVDDNLESFGSSHIPAATANSYYHDYVTLVYLPRSFVIPVFLLFFIIALYFVGRFLAAGVGRMLVIAMERVIAQLPLIRNVYSSVKQVTDFVFTERDIGFTRVVAVEYPRRGVWSIGFVTGESLLDISAAANEPVLCVLIPSSPMPMTGYTITVAKSEAIDLNLTVDQAIQFMVSCGVVVPIHQQRPPSRLSIDLPPIEDSAVGEKKSENLGKN